MNVKLARFTIGTAVLILFLAIGLSARAQSITPATPAAPKKAATAAADSAASGLLSQAYAALAVADHDYQGHRVKAMKHIEVAAKVLGVTLGGNGTGHEAQATSDQQLRTAQTLLQQALVPGPRPRVQKQINLALIELSTALSIK
jgi:lysophospholipase L1-like esterase